MSRKLGRNDLDRLLREALASEPEAHVERRRDDVRTAWARARARGVALADAAGPALLIPVAPGSSLLAGAAAVMLAVGLALQLALPPRLVADSLSVRQTAVRVDAQIRRALAMTVRVERADERGRLRRYRIEWRAPGEVLVESDGPEGPGRHRLRLTPAATGPFAPAAPDEAIDPLLQPARDFLSPGRVASLLDGGWTLVTGSGREAARVFDVSKPGWRAPLRVAIDPRIDLPVRLEAKASASFEWEAGATRLPPLGEAAQPGR